MLTSKTFTEGVRAAIASGGCNSSRAGFGAACLAAQEADNFPTEWTSKYAHFARAEELAKTLVSFRKN